ncbi:MAG: Fpg/Nei family DNA glycosylase [Acidimicrobiia bacterium]
MPELPDIEVYIHALDSRIRGEVLQGLRISSPSVLRTYDPSYETAAGRRVDELRRVGKRIVFELEGDLFVVVHLMVAGRLRWETPGKPIPKKVGLAALDFETGAVILTEQGTRRRAGVWLFQGWEGVAALDRGGIEPLEASKAEFASVLMAENRTLKRALTDPRILSGIGNAYSDEILWRAQLSPIKRTAQLTAEETDRLHQATVDTLQEWTGRLLAEAGDGWPRKVTAFRPEMAVHGKYGHPCSRCGSTVQRIVFADNETNYCAGCQTGGRLLADRALSRLLKADWPRTLEELEE